LFLLEPKWEVGAILSSVWKECAVDGRFSYLIRLFKTSGFSVDGYGFDYFSGSKEGA
jgi:hypothetical protein